MKPRGPTVAASLHYGKYTMTLYLLERSVTLGQAILKASRHEQRSLRRTKRPAGVPVPFADA